MDTSTMFEQASRLKLRFQTSRGALTVEDLWDLPLTSPSGRAVNLDAIALSLHKLVRDEADVVSFVTATTAPAGDTILAFEIVKYVIGVKKQERDALLAAADRKEKKQKLLELIARKEDEQLGQKSVDELRTMVEAL